MFSRPECPLGDPKKCPGYQLHNERGEVVNTCAFCSYSKKRIKADLDRQQQGI